MARTEKKLTARYVDTATKPGRHSDGGGLYLNVTKTGAKSWLFMWSRGTGKDAKRQEIGLGSLKGRGKVAPVSLAHARDIAIECRQLLANGKDPRSIRNDTTRYSFGEVADMFIKENEPAWRNDKHRAQWRMTLEHYAKPMRRLPVDEIDTEHVLKVLQPIWQNKTETANRLRGRIERVLDYATARRWRTGDNPARWRGHLKSILPNPEKRSRGHHKAMAFKQVPGFVVQLRDMSNMSALALEFCILTATRTSETLKAELSEFDLDAGLWVIPANRMKADKVHRIPLSGRALEIVTKQAEYSTGALVFPGNKPGKPLSSMAMAMMLRRLKVDCTVHGFRSSFRDWVGETTNYPREVVEHALAHVIASETERAYRRGDALEKRQALMQSWADYCAGVEGGNVVRLY